ncbi:MAG: SDR family oxidoreductase [Elusimicrobiaceae bacterium]|nr:SDR family oxidoreductase [Elusimicrobiaceae bacterium]
MPVKKISKLKSPPEANKPLWLVTGGAGFIGSNIAEELVNRGERVRILDNMSTGRKEHMASFIDRVEFVHADLRDPKSLGKALKGVTYVLHQAALRSVPKSMDAPQPTNENNVTGTLNLLVEAGAAGVKRVVYASSSSAYGECKVFPQHEGIIPAPVSPYAVSKLAAEMYCLCWAKSFGLEAVALRYFNVFGPRQDPESKYSAVIPKFMEQARQRRPLEIHWDGRQSRDFTYVGNVVQANIKAATAPNASGRAYNIACGTSNSLLELARVIEKLAGYKLAKDFQPKRKGDVRKTYADISLARRVLKYKPEVGFEEGIKKTWEYFQDKF